MLSALLSALLSFVRFQYRTQRVVRRNNLVHNIMPPVCVKDIRVRFADGRVFLGKNKLMQVFLAQKKQRSKPFLALFCL